jgi:hypothetical protein
MIDWTAGWWMVDGWLDGGWLMDGWMVDLMVDLMIEWID